MKRLALSITLVVALLVPATAEAKPYRLGKAEAAYYMKIALKRQFGGTFTAGHSKTVKCRHRIRPGAILCRTIEWATGDLGFKGWGKIWITYRQGRPFWNYGYNLKRVDWYCIDTGQSGCIKRIVEW